MTVPANNPSFKNENNKLVVNDIPSKYVNSNHVLAIRLKENCSKYNYVLKCYLTIQKDEYSFDCDNFGYYECDILNGDNEIVFEDKNTFIGNVSVTLNVETFDGIIRNYFELMSDDFQENTLALVNEMEQTYFEQTQLKKQVDIIFDEFKKSATDFVYIQDPYFDYYFYSDLIENLPANLVVKVLYSKDKIKNMPQTHNIITIEDDATNGRIHDRYIVTQHFGYYIGISLNGVHKNKSSLNKIDNTTELLKYFEQ